MTVMAFDNEPDVRAMRLHLAWLTFLEQSTVSGLRVEIAWGDPDQGPNRSRTYGIADLKVAADFAAWVNRKGCNVYVGATLKCADAPLMGRTRSDHAALATCVPIDSDNQFVATAAKLGSIVKPQLIVLTGRYPESRGQMFVRIKPTPDLGAWETLHERIVRHCGGDESALGRNRLMRLAGSVSYPSPKKIARGYLVERTSVHFVPAPEYCVSELIAAFPAPILAQSAPVYSSRGFNTCPPRRAKPPLTAVEAALRSLPDIYADQQRLWIKVGFALFDFDPSPTGMALWRNFSQRCPEKAGETDFADVWSRIGRPYRGRRITISWLMREACKPSVGA